MTKSRNRGGRPTSYTPEQLDQAIATAEQRWPEITWEHVKAVEPLLAKRQRIREDEMIARLPGSMRAVIAEAAADIERVMALTCGRHAAQGEVDRAARSEEEARQRLELVRRLVEVEAKLDEALAGKQAMEAKLASQRAAIEARDRQLAKAQKRITRLEGKIEGLKLTSTAARTEPKEQPLTDRAA